jgi:N-acetylmuramoyl-L-alanine amidase
MKLTKLRNGLIVLVGVLIVIAGILLWQQGRFSPPEADTSVLTVGTPNPSGESNGSGHAADARNGAAALQHLEAPLLEQDENLRRWPGESLLSADLTGGAPRLADFKGRPYGEEALKGAVIFLDYGHGGVDAGTVYPTRPPHELLEKTLNIEIGRILKKKLEQLGAEVVEIRKDDTWISIYERSAFVGEYLVNRSVEAVQAGSVDFPVERLQSYQRHFDRIYELNRDKGGGDILGGSGQSQKTRLLYDLQKQYENCIFISLHCNYSEQSSEAKGIQVYYLDNGSAFAGANGLIGRDYIDNPDDRMYPVYQNYDDENRLRLATTIHSTVVDEIPELTTRNAGTVLPYSFAVLRCTGLNSALVEMGFVSNSEDRALLASKDGQERIAEALAKSLYRYYCEGEVK